MQGEDSVIHSFALDERIENPYTVATILSLESSSVSCTMPKIKTHKATAKRFVIKKSKKDGKKVMKIMKRTDGQDHFNARESGKTKRNKRSDKVIALAQKKTIIRAMPHAL